MHLFRRAISHAPGTADAVLRSHTKEDVMVRKLILMGLVAIGFVGGCRAHAGGHVGGVGAHVGASAGH
jgi:hypothetical protein